MRAEGKHRVALKAAARPTMPPPMTMIRDELNCNKLWSGLLPVNQERAVPGQEFPETRDAHEKGQLGISLRKGIFAFSTKDM